MIYSAWLPVSDEELVALPRIITVVRSSKRGQSATTGIHETWLHTKDEELALAILIWIVDKLAIAPCKQELRRTR